MRTQLPTTLAAKTYHIHKMHSLSVVVERDDHENRLGEARQTPGTGLAAAARDSRPVPCPAANYFRSPPRGTQSDQTRPPAWELSAAWTNRRWKNGNGPGNHHADFQSRAIVPLRYVRISNARRPWAAARGASWRKRLSRRGARTRRRRVTALRRSGKGAPAGARYFPPTARR